MEGVAACPRRRAGGRGHLAAALAPAARGCVTVGLRRRTRVAPRHCGIKDVLEWECGLECKDFGKELEKLAAIADAAEISVGPVVLLPSSGWLRFAPVHTKSSLAPCLHVFPWVLTSMAF